MKFFLSIQSPRADSDKDEDDSEQPSTDQADSSQEAASESPLPPPVPQKSIKIAEEQHSIRIIRGPGQGLGMSIAGGHGSTPYRGDDEVWTIIANRESEGGCFLKV